MAADLNKRTQTAGAILAKKGLTAPPIMRVALAIDISGSMADEFRDGSVQQVIDQLLGVAAKFDDDGSIDVFKFDDRAEYVGVCEASNYGSYVRDSRLAVRGGTRYVPIIDLIPTHMFGASVAAAPAKSGIMGMFAKKPEPAAPSGGNNMPVLVFFITDGESADSYDAVKASLVASGANPIYWQMIGINNQGEEFRTLKKLGDALPNVGFIKMNGFNQTDEQLYGEVISDELVAWVKTSGRGAQVASA